MKRTEAVAALAAGPFADAVDLAKGPTKTFLYFLVTAKRPGAPDYERKVTAPTLMGRPVIHLAYERARRLADGAAWRGYDASIARYEGSELEGVKNGVTHYQLMYTVQARILPPWGTK